MTEPEVDEENSRVLRRVGLVEYEEIARMRICVEKPIHEDLPRIGASQDFEHSARGGSNPRKSSSVCDPDNRPIGDAEHTLAGMARNHARHHDLGVARKV